MPAISYHFGLSPADIWAMTFREYAAYQKASIELTKAAG